MFIVISLQVSRKLEATWILINRWRAKCVVLHSPQNNMAIKKNIIGFLPADSEGFVLCVIKWENP